MSTTKTTWHFMQRLLTALFALALIVALLPTAAQAQQTTYPGIQEEIPEDANRILLEQRSVPPVEMYVSALNYFERTDWEVIASEETKDLTALEGILSDTDGPLAFAVQKEVAPDLALRIAIHVDLIPAGGRLIASADYATGIPAQRWQDAAWTNGKAQRAFFEALEILRRTAYDSADFEVGVAVEPDNE